MDTSVLENLVNLPAFYFSLVYAFVILYYTCSSRRRTQTVENRIVSGILSLICLALECLTMYYAWTHLVLTLQLVEVGSSSPFLWHDWSKCTELSCVLLQICFTNSKIKHIHVSLEIPLLLLADYAYNHSNVQPMIIVILLNSFIQIMVHIFHIVDAVGVRDIQEECWYLNETSISCYQMLEYLVLLVICVVGWNTFEYAGFNIFLSIFIFTLTTICCLFTTARDD